MKITTKAAIKLWTASRRSNLIRLSRTLSRGGTVEDIARVEVFAVHPDEKPQENIRIPGFNSRPGADSRD